LLNDVSPDALRLLNILMDAWARTDQWPKRQYVAREMATAGRQVAIDAAYTLIDELDPG
jgi:hypothetical protein